MLHPNQFQVNETWIVFKLTEQPIHTVRDGDFDFIALMDAASCFILGTMPVPTRLSGPSAKDCRRLLEEGRAHKSQLPKTLFVSVELPAAALATEALSQGIEVVEVEQSQLLPFTGEAIEAFREHFGGDGGKGDGTGRI